MLSPRASFLRQQLPEIGKRIDVLSPRMIRIVEDSAAIGDVSMSVSTRHGRDRTTGTWQRELRQLMTVPGIGPIIASAMVAPLAMALLCQARLALARLVPKQMSTVIGRSLGASASAAIATAHAVHAGRPRYSAQTSKLGKHSFGPWLTAAAKRLHTMFWRLPANKLARIAGRLAQRRNYDCASYRCA